MRKSKLDVAYSQLLSIASKRDPKIALRAWTKEENARKRAKEEEERKRRIARQKEENARRLVEEAAEAEAQKRREREKAKARRLREEKKKIHEFEHAQNASDLLIKLYAENLERARAAKWESIGLLAFSLIFSIYFLFLFKDWKVASSFYIWFFVLILGVFLFNRKLFLKDRDRVKCLKNSKPQYFKSLGNRLISFVEGNLLFIENTFRKMNNKIINSLEGGIKRCDDRYLVSSGFNSLAWYFYILFVVLLLPCIIASLYWVGLLVFKMMN